ncbi:MAG: hypothetical protein WDN49_27160 [Acetobacteraceae bacterium]
MSPSLTAFAYLIAAVLFILALRGALQPGQRPQRQPLRHGGHDHRHPGDAGRSGMSGSGYALIIAGIVIGGGIGITSPAASR